MKKFIRTAIDLGKTYFQVHGLESEGGPSISRKMKRSKMREFTSRSSLAGSVWRRAVPDIIGPASSWRWGTK